MNLREKTLVVLGITFICAFVLILALSLTFYLGSATDLEKGQAEKDTRRALHAIENEAGSLDSLVGEWAWWDETVRFSNDFNGNYLAANLNDSTVRNIRINYFMIVSQNGTILFSRGYDLKTGRDMPVPGEFLADFKEVSPAILSIKTQERVTGVMVGHGRTFFIGSGQILTSALDSPGSGYLIFVRTIDEKELARLSDITGGYISFDVPIGNPGGQDAVFILVPLAPSAVTIDQTDPFQLTGTATLDDETGMPGLFISIRKSRDIYQSALVIIRNYLVIITVMMALFAGVVILLIDRMVLNRLAILVDRVRERDDLTAGQALPPMTGNDEFMRLDDLIAESQRKIRESEAQYRRIIETAHEGIIIVNTNQTITYANDRMAGMLGLTPADMTGKPLRELIPGDEMAEHVKRTASRKSGASERYERRLLGKDGRIVWTLISSTPVFAGPDYAGAFAMVTDITDRKRAELALDLATKKLSTLSTITFNDLQSQLFTLQGYTELAEANAPEGKVKEYISRQRDVANRIRQQIAFAHTIQKMGTRPPSWQNVNRAFLFAISHLDLSAIARTTDLGNLEIYVDPLFETVLYSLVDNSIRHGGAVTAITVSFHTGDQRLVLLYEDNGAGISPEMKETIFEQRYSSGSGVSLFLAREILSLTGITIRETGIYTRGVRFEITVPEGGFRFTDADKPGPA